MNRFYNSFRLRFMLLCMAAIFLIIAAAHVAMYVVLRDIISEQIGLSAQITAMAISGGIMEDADGYKEFLETRDVNSEYYQRMQKYFARVKSSGAFIRFIYTERPVDDETVEFVLDAEPVGSKDYSAPGDTTFMDEASRSVYTTRLPARLKPTYHPEYGTLIGGCAPIFDKTGEMLGLVGVNVDISTVLDHLSGMQFALLFIYVVIMAVCLALLNRYACLILEPIFKDKMTGAYSKRHYETLMKRELQNATKNGTDLALLMLDLDHFKKVNDTYGHDFGDKVLAATADRIMGCLRANDCLVRYGGEEFAIIVPNVNMETALVIAERARVAIERLEIHNDETNLPVKITISVGVSHLGGRPCSGKQLMDEADKALYDAKTTRNTVSSFVNREK